MASKIAKLPINEKMAATRGGGSTDDANDRQALCAVTPRIDAITNNSVQSSDAVLMRGETDVTEIAFSSMGSSHDIRDDDVGLASSSSMMTAGHGNRDVAHNNADVDDADVIDGDAIPTNVVHEKPRLFRTITSPSIYRPSISAPIVKSFSRFNIVHTTRPGRSNVVGISFGSRNNRGNDTNDMDSHRLFLPTVASSSYDSVTNNTTTRFDRLNNERFDRINACCHYAWYHILKRSMHKFHSTFLSRKVTQAMIDLEQAILSKSRLLRYVFFVAFSFFTFLDILKVDAYHSALLNVMIDSANTDRTIKQISSILVANEVAIASIQMLVVGVLEKFFLPSIWCFLSFLVTILTWITFDTPDPRDSRLFLIFFLRALNVRYSVVVYWLGKRYDSYTMIVQFFISLLPSILKLPLFHFYRHVIIFGLQYQLLLLAIMTFVIFVSVYSFCVTRFAASSLSCQSRSPMELNDFSATNSTAAVHVSSNASRFMYDKSGSWLCNLACVFFLAGVYYDFPIFTTFAVVYLNYDITYDIIYIHIGLFVTVFFVNIGYNTFRVIHRRYLRRLYGNNRVEIEIHRNEKRYLFAIISYACVILSRVCFLILQLTEYPSATALTVCICLAGLGGNVQPLLAEMMFRQRNHHHYYQPQSQQQQQQQELQQSQRYLPRCHRFEESINTRTTTTRTTTIVTRSVKWCKCFWKRYSDQAFKWFYMDGKSIVNLLLLTLWMTCYNFVGVWWFSMNSILFLVASMTMFIVYYRRYIQVV